MKRVVVLTFLLFLSAVLIPTKMKSQLPGEKLELSISNPLNYTRTDEAAIIRWINLTEEGVPEDANPDSFRVTDEDGIEVPSQFDDLTDYGYEKYLVFPATVPGGSNATYYLYYTTGTFAKPGYTEAVTITDEGTAYSFTAQNYTGMINKASGVMTSLKTSHSGELLTGRGFDSGIFGSDWSPAWLQVDIDDAETTLHAEGPVRSIIVTEGALGPNSEWSFTTIYLLYKDRVEAMTQQVYTGEGMQLMQARVGISHPVNWTLDGKATLDTPPEPFTETIQLEYEGYFSNWSPEWEGNVWTIYPIRDNYPDNGKWADVTSANQSFGYGVIIYDSASIVRIELTDGRAWALPSPVIELNVMKYSEYPSGPIPPAAAMEPLWYHWTLLPHEKVNYTYTETEAEKAYHPLGFEATTLPPPKQFPVWVVYLAFFAAAAAIMVFFARKSLKSS